MLLPLDTGLAKTHLTGNNIILSKSKHEKACLKNKHGRMGARVYLLFRIFFLEGMSVNWVL